MCHPARLLSSGERTIRVTRTNYHPLLYTQIELLKNMLLDIEKHIQPGVMRINWNSLNISEYAHECEILLKNLNSLVEQLNHIKSDLDNRIFNELQNYDLFSLPTKYYNEENELIVLLPCKIFFQEMQIRRVELATSMAVTYRSTSPILIKLESLIFGTYTGKCASMQLYYEKYEKKIFSAFIT